MKGKLTLNTLVALLILPIFVVVGLILSYNNIERKQDLNNIDFINESISQTLPFSAYLRQAGVGLRYATGEALQDGIFISQKELISNLEPANSEYVQKNTQAILNFKERFLGSDPSVYAMIIPSSSGVLADNLPAFSTTVNQRNLIENIYNQFAGDISTINVFNVLFENKDKYIYFRTEDTITPLGGYYIYSEMVRRMLVAGDITNLSDYGIYYGPDEFYGELYNIKPFKNVLPDLLSYYEYNGILDYNIIHIHKSGSTRYNGLYNRNRSDLDSYRYGLNGILDIKTDNKTNRELLIIGDDSAIFLLPFIYHHYDKVTYVNIKDLDYLSDFVPTERYDQILIAVEIDSFIHSSTLGSVLDSFSN